MNNSKPSYEKQNPNPESLQVQSPNLWNNKLQNEHKNGFQSSETQRTLGKRKRITSLMEHPQKQTTSAEDKLTVKSHKPQNKMNHHKGKSADINIQENMCSPPN